MELLFNNSYDNTISYESFNDIILASSNKLKIDTKKLLISILQIINHPYYHKFSLSTLNACLDLTRIYLRVIRYSNKLNKKILELLYIIKLSEQYNSLNIHYYNIVPFKIKQEIFTSNIRKTSPPVFSF